MHSAAGSYAIQARSLTGLELSDVECPTDVRESGDHRQHVRPVEQHDSAGRHVVDQSHAVFGQAVQEILDIEITDQPAGKIDERAHHGALAFRWRDAGLGG